MLALSVLSHWFTYSVAPAATTLYQPPCTRHMSASYLASAPTCWPAPHWYSKIEKSPIWVEPALKSWLSTVHGTFIWPTLTEKPLPNDFVMLA